MNTLYVKKLNPLASLPKRQTPQSAGYDLCACFDKTDGLVQIKPNQTALIPTGLAISPNEKNIALLIFARSSVAVKLGLAPANCVGVVDSDYRGEVKVALFNHSNETRTICHGERIAQLVITPIFTPEVEEVQNLDETVRGSGGFGSTGTGAEK